MAVTLYRQVGKGKARRSQKVCKASDLLPTTGLPRRLGAFTRYEQYPGIMLVRLFLRPG